MSDPKKHCTKTPDGANVEICDSLRHALTKDNGRSGVHIAVLTNPEKRLRRSQPVIRTSVANGRFWMIRYCPFCGRNVRTKAIKS